MNPPRLALSCDSGWLLGCKLLHDQAVEYSANIEFQDLFMSFHKQAGQSPLARINQTIFMINADINILRGNLGGIFGRCSIEKFTLLLNISEQGVRGLNLF